MSDVLGEYLRKVPAITPAGPELVCLSVNGETRTTTIAAIGSEYLPLAGGTMTGTITLASGGPDGVHLYNGDVLIDQNGDFHFSFGFGHLTNSAALRYPGPGLGIDGPYLADVSQLFRPDGNLLANNSPQIYLTCPVVDALGLTGGGGAALVSGIGGLSPTWGATPIADGTYTVGGPLTPMVGLPGTITTVNGIITAIQQAT